MGLFFDCLFGCDIDGTLLVNGIINPRNIEKILRYETHITV